jgi:hypothetical protein
MKFQCIGLVINVDQFTQKINELAYATTLGVYTESGRGVTDKSMEWILKRVLDDIFPFVNISNYQRHDSWYERSYYQLKNMYGSSFEIDFSRALLDVLPMRYISSDKLSVSYYYNCLILRKNDGSSWF